jgi:hypothetical protein
MILNFFRDGKLLVSIHPSHYIARPILQRLGKMRLLHPLTPCEVGNGAAELEYAVAQAVGLHARPHFIYARCRSVWAKSLPTQSKGLCAYFATA